MTRPDFIRSRLSEAEVSALRDDLTAATARALASDTARASAETALAEARYAITALLAQWDAFEASDGNQAEAYYKLAKYARPAWNRARTALEPRT